MAYGSLPFLNVSEANRSDVGKRAGLLLRAVAVGAEPVVDRLAAIERLVVESRIMPGVVDVVLVLGERKRDRGGGAQLAGPRRVRPREFR